MRWRRSSLISTVDALAFVALVFLIGTGFLLKFALPPGSGQLFSSGGGWRAAQRPIALVWGLTRHEWGAIHFWLSVAFLMLMALHLLIHWKWIRASFKGPDPAATRLQAGLGIAALVGLLALTLMPLVAPKETTTRGALQEERGLGSPSTSHSADDVRAMFSELLAMETEERHRMVRDAVEVNDL